MDEDDICHHHSSEPAAVLEPEQESFGDFCRMILLMSLETELRALVRRMNAGEC